MWPHPANNAPSGCIAVSRLAAFAAISWAYVRALSSDGGLRPLEGSCGTRMRNAPSTAFPSSLFVPSESSIGIGINDITDDGKRRRRLFFEGFLSSLALLSQQPATAEEARDPPEDERITVPLEWNGEAYLLYYRIGGDLFRAVVDTGSPFLMVPGTCDATTKFKWGCYRNEGVPSGLRPTYEFFDGVEGEVEWRTGSFAFVNATGSMFGPPRMVFGVASPRLMGGPGGVFFGLVRDTDDWIRPSFLGQTAVESFNIDLASPVKTLTLSTAPMIRHGDSYIQLVNDLRRRYGDPTLHYTARAQSIVANGSPLATDGRPIYAIFDTGVTGMVVSREIFDERYVLARERREKKLWKDVKVSFRTSGGETVTMSASSPLTTPFAQKPWKKFNAHLVVLGLSFLEGNSLTIDLGTDRLRIG